MLDWLNIHLGEIIGLIHALEKRYYQTKTELRYNFGSVCMVCLMRQKRFEPQHDKTNKVTIRPAKTQISLGMHPVWLESSLCTQ